MTLGSFGLSPGRGGEARGVQRRARQLFLCAVLCFFILGCVPAVQVRTSQDPAAKLGDFQSFAMLLPNRPLPSENTAFDPFALQRLRQLTYLTLKQKGYSPKEKQQADLLVAVTASKDSRVHVYSTGTYGYGYTFDPGYRTVSVQEVREGIVAIDLIDAKKKSVIWRGTGVRSMDRALTDSQWRETVQTILERFPSRGSALP